MTRLPGYALLVLRSAHQRTVADLDRARDALQRAELQVVDAREDYTRTVAQERELALTLAAHRDAIALDEATRCPGCNVPGGAHTGGCVAARAHRANIALDAMSATTQDA